MRHPTCLCAGLIFALVLPASATQAAGLVYLVAYDAKSTPPTQLSPATK